MNGPELGLGVTWLTDSGSQLAVTYGMGMTDILDLYSAPPKPFTIKPLQMLPPKFQDATSAGNLYE
jgi:hypothetical protein